MKKTFLILISLISILVVRGDFSTGSSSQEPTFINIDSLATVFADSIRMVDLREKFSADSLMRVDSLKKVTADSLNFLVFQKIYDFEEHSFDSLSLSAILQQKLEQTFKAYRICVYNGTSQNAREEASVAEEMIDSLFMGMWHDVIYEAPVFKVFVGACLNRTEATILLSRIRVYFPSAFIVTDRIATARFFGTPSYTIPVTVIDTTELNDSMFFDPLSLLLPSSSDDTYSSIQN